MTSTLGNENALVPGLARHLLGCKGAIVDSWTETVRSDPAVQSATALSKADFVDHIPSILEALGEELLGSPRQADERPILSSGGQHGVFRWRQGYDLEEVMREISHLRLVLQGFAAGFCEREATHPEDRLTVVRQIDSTIDSAQFATTRKYMEHRDAEAARLYDELREAGRAKDDFLATLSHELRSPLTMMLGWGTMLRGGGLDQATAARALERLEHGARLQTRLIDDLLDVSRIISGKLQIEPQVLDLSELVRKAVEDQLPRAEAKSIRLERSSEVTDALVCGDPSRLEQVLGNLFNNAVKFTPQGGSIGVRLVRHGSRARLTVSDSGKGIDPEFLPHVFDRFLQADTSRTRAEGGLGLGLAIVRHLVELHQGTVTAESLGEGHGSSFHVELPLLAAVISSESRVAEGVEEPVVVRSSKLEGCRVLVVDDEVEVRELLTTMLEVCGARVTAVRSAREAVRHLESAAADVLVSDIGLPGEDGYSLVQTIRAREKERGERLPALALSGYAGLDDEKRARSAGFQRHLAKPVEFTEFIATVASLIPPREKPSA